METKENYVEMLVLKQNLAIDLVTEDNKIPMISPSGATKIDPKST